MTIQSVVSADILVLQAVSERCLLALDGIDAAERAAIIDHSAKNIDTYAVRKDCVFLKCLQHDQIVGFTLLKQFWNLSDLFVLPEYQKCGFGRALLIQAIGQAKKLSDKDTIWVNSSLTAEGFYRKLGFEDRTQGLKPSSHSVPLVYKF